MRRHGFLHLVSRRPPPCCARWPSGVTQSPRRTVPAKGKTNVGEEVNQIQPPPIGHCHACPLAKSFQYHYIESPNKSVKIDPTVDVYCQGAANPPRNCPSNKFQSNANFTACVCRDGYFMNPAGECEDCPVGSYCVGGESALCPKHTYQDKTRATACTGCVETRDEYGVYSDCGENQQLRVCEEGQRTPPSKNCVPCTRCRRAYLTRVRPRDPNEGEVDCYRSNA